MANNKTLFCTATLMLTSDGTIFNQINFRLHVQSGISEETCDDAGLTATTAVMPTHREDVVWVIDNHTNPIFGRIYTRELLVGSTQFDGAFSIRENERFVANEEGLFLRTLISLLAL